ncbi:phosphatidylserine/phosphatidylglycerophosphate/cardiolipin synthase family protein [Porphyrobacter sp. GA68]|uniref:phospholipase D-like domain-containing protein n=1 Tax=Porphyrobacter sp. GA68 TaxID=2883480 RepID=UPI001D1971B1|nr:phosphatidylserine/phosphatidylglycerophosphate/cardiolipin synthase family protein [Porphyrobacter sp. GA68]
MGGGHSSKAASEPDYRPHPPLEAQVGPHRLTVLADGPDRWRALLNLINSAQRRLDVCFYIYATDRSGAAVRDALTAAARRGVAVTVILDSFGADADAGFFADMCAAGGRFLCFSPRLTQRYLIRNHQKMVIADDRVAMFGGFNVEDSYFSAPNDDGWEDLAVLIEGPAVAGLVELFARLSDWTSAGHPKFLRLRRASREWQWSDGQLRWLIGGPSKSLSRWVRCVSEDLHRAKRLDMVMAYFTPPNSLMRAIGRIAKRGEARLVMAAKSDNDATIGATRSLYDYLLRQGVGVWEFMPRKLHTKLVVVDDAVYLGSANFDVRSLYLNLELMLRVDDAGFAARMREFNNRYVAASQRITPALHKRRATVWNRMRWNMSWLLVSVIDYTVTRKLNLGP